jgi:hypothetical protein
LRGGGGLGGDNETQEVLPHPRLVVREALGRIETNLIITGDRFREMAMVVRGGQSLESLLMQLMEGLGAFHGSDDHLIEPLFDDLKEEIAQRICAIFVTEHSRVPWLPLSFRFETKGGAVWPPTLVGRNGIGNTLNRRGDGVLVVVQEILCSLEEGKMLKDVGGRVGNHSEWKAEKISLPRGEWFSGIGATQR